MWIGTAGGGLARYDAERDHFQVFRAGAATGLAGDYVRTLHADPDGDLWVGCFGVTLQRFDPRRGLARDLPLGRPPQLQRVHRVINLPDGIGVALVIAEGVVRWDGTSTTRNVFPHPLGGGSGVSGFVACWRNSRWISSCRGEQA